MNTIQPSDLFCYIHASRGYGDGMFKILSQTKDSCTVQPVSGGKSFNIYKAHLYTDFQSKQLSIRTKEASAEAIGRPKKKPGKG